MRKMRSFACTDCNQPVTRRRSTGQPLVCINCGINHSTQNAIALYTDAVNRRGWHPDGTLTPAGAAALRRINRTLST